VLLVYDIHHTILDVFSQEMIGLKPGIKNFLRVDEKKHISTREGRDDMPSDISVNG
jgi:hypothetical protein